MPCMVGVGRRRRHGHRKIMVAAHRSSFPSAMDGSLSPLALLHAMRQSEGSIDHSQGILKYAKLDLEGVALLWELLH